MIHDVSFANEVETRIITTNQRRSSQAWREFRESAVHVTTSQICDETVAWRDIGWQEHAIAPAAELVKLDKAMHRPFYALGVLGMPGLTAYAALLDIGEPAAPATTA